MINTIGNAEWKKLKDAAMKANKEKPQDFSDQGVKARKHSALQNKKRHQN